MLNSLMLFAAVFLSSNVVGADFVFEGPWHTTNRKLDGIMIAEVTDLGNEKWQGRFHGIWMGVPFDYTEKFQGKKQSLSGTAVIDHANYTWTGSINEEEGTFSATFGGDRYIGGFKLLRKEAKPAKKETKQAAEVRETAEAKVPPSPYVWHQNRWWYRTQDNGWLYWNGSGWTAHKLR